MNEEFFSNMNFDISNNFVLPNLILKEYKFIK